MLDRRSSGNLHVVVARWQLIFHLHLQLVYLIMFIMAAFLLHFSDFYVLFIRFWRVVYSLLNHFFYLIIVSYGILVFEVIPWTFLTFASVFPHLCNPFWYLAKLNLRFLFSNFKLFFFIEEVIAASWLLWHLAFCLSNFSLFLLAILFPLLTFRSG